VSFSRWSGSRKTFPIFSMSLFFDHFFQSSANIGRFSLAMPRRGGISIAKSAELRTQQFNQQSKETIPLATMMRTKTNGGVPFSILTEQTPLRLECYIIQVAANCHARAQFIWLGKTAIAEL
jgi:hypothetical protein